MINEGLTSIEPAKPSHPTLQADYERNYWGSSGMMAALPTPKMQLTRPTLLSGGGEATTQLYRTVMQTELDDIASRGAFRNPAGIEVKYFSTSPEGAASYARQAARGFGDGPFTLVETSIPTRLIAPEMRVVVDRGVDTVVVPTQSLPSLSAPQVWDFMPVPR